MFTLNATADASGGNKYNVPPPCPSPLPSKSYLDVQLPATLLPLPESPSRSKNFKDRQLVRELLERADAADNETRHLLQEGNDLLRGIGHAHEMGGDGDTCMGSETAHKKRKAEDGSESDNTAPEDDPKRTRNFLQRNLMSMFESN